MAASAGAEVSGLVGALVAERMGVEVAVNGGLLARGEGRGARYGATVRFGGTEGRATARSASEFSFSPGFQQRERPDRCVKTGASARSVPSALAPLPRSPVATRLVRKKSPRRRRASAAEPILSKRIDFTR